MSTPEQQTPRRERAVLTQPTISTRAMRLARMIQFGIHDADADMHDEAVEMATEFVESTLARANDTGSYPCSRQDARALVDLCEQTDIPHDVWSVGVFHNAQIATDTRIYHISWREDDPRNSIALIQARLPDYIEAEAYDFDIEEVIEVVGGEYGQGDIDADDYCQDAQYEDDYSQEGWAGC